MAGQVWGRIMGVIVVIILMMVVRILGFDIRDARRILGRPDEREQQRQDLEEGFLYETDQEHAEVKVLNSKGQVDWSWHSEVTKTGGSTYIP